LKKSKLKSNFKISVVIPCFNEEGNIPVLFEKITSQLAKYKDYELIFVDDGSQDNTLTIIKQLATQSENTRYLSFSRNFGHENAIKAGIDNAAGDCIINIDADLQHPPHVIPVLIDKWLEGYDVVYTVRSDEENMSFRNKLTSRIYYKMFNYLSDTKIAETASDFRLIDRKVADVIKSLKENFLFMRALLSWIGFKHAFVVYKPEPRFSGQTKYSVSKLFRLAFTGITSFSIRPLQISIVLGCIIAFLAFLYGLYVIYIVCFTDKAVQGWASITASVLFIGGLQLIMIGILGEYLGKLFMENKRRPNYIIKEMN
jgi:polyisoprenyl-phosphate glycosyltransferase